MNVLKRNQTNSSCRHTRAEQQAAPSKRTATNTKSSSWWDAGGARGPSRVWCFYWNSSRVHSRWVYRDVSLLPPSLTSSCEREWEQRCRRQGKCLFPIIRSETLLPSLSGATLSFLCTVGTHTHNCSCWCVERYTAAKTTLPTSYKRWCTNAAAVCHMIISEDNKTKTTFI